MANSNAIIARILTLARRSVAEEVIGSDEYALDNKYMNQKENMSVQEQVVILVISGVENTE